MAENGVRHGQLNIVALEAEHHHAHDAHGAPHVHYRPAPTAKVGILSRKKFSPWSL